MVGSISNEDEELLGENINSNAETKRKKYPNIIYSSNLPTTLSSLKKLQASKVNCMNRKGKKTTFICVSIISCIFVFILYANVQCPSNSIFCTEKPIPLTNTEKIPHLKGRPTFEDILDKDFQFNIEGHDVMVFLHIQKTGGTQFGNHLVKDLELERRCVCHRKVKKRCTCLRPGIHSDETWLFSRMSTGWKCGLHADWTELTGCVNEEMNRIEDKDINRRYFYITYLRDPIHRYLSEFRHVGRGATWKNTLLFCGGRPATEEEVPLCYDGEDWDDVTMEKFYSCKSNLANNRQTRMLADLNLVNCYNMTAQYQQDRDEIMLESAKKNLDRMVFFGLTEFQEKSQYIFEETFNFNFSTRFIQDNRTTAYESLDEITKGQLQSISDTNHLDVRLYQYAKTLFQKRYEKLKSLDTKFDNHFHNMGHSQFSWESVDKPR